LWGRGVLFSSPPAYARRLHEVSFRARNPPAHAGGYEVRFSEIRRLMPAATGGSGDGGGLFFGVGRENAGDERALVWLLLDLQGSADELGAVVHDAEAEIQAMVQGRRERMAVALHGENQAAVFVGKRD